MHCYICIYNTYFACVYCILYACKMHAYICTYYIHAYIVIKKSLLDLLRRVYLIM